jgi:RimJ/RimL family protein N-acetyltransferase
MPLRGRWRTRRACHSCALRQGMRGTRFMITIRQINMEDAEAYLNLRTQLDYETKFMMLEPGERQFTIELERERLKSLLATDNSMVFLAEDEREAIGFLWANGGMFRRSHHNAHIVIGIRAAFTKQGIGTRLFQACEAWARERGLHRLELTVMTNNSPGIALYKKMGFQIEGTAPDALRVDGAYVDLHYMSKLL